MKYLKFTGSWCSPCKQLKPIMEQVKQQNIKVEEIDVDDQSDLAEKYNIRSVPTVILINNNGVEINRLIGVKTLNEYIENYNSNK
jgi:thioredoxin 1